MRTLKPFPLIIRWVTISTVSTPYQQECFHQGACNKCNWGFILTKVRQLYENIRKLQIFTSIDFAKMGLGTPMKMTKNVNPFKTVDINLHTQHSCLNYTPSNLETVV